MEGEGHAFVSCREYGFDWAGPSVCAEGMRGLAPLVGLLVLFSGTSVLPLGAAKPLGLGQDPAEAASQRREVTVMIDMLQGYHYADRRFNELRADAFMERFLRSLDPDALVFSAAEVGFFHKRFDRSIRSVYLFRGDPKPAYDICDRFKKLAAERAKWVGGQLGAPYTWDASLLSEDRKPGSKPDWAADAPTLDRRWDLLLRRDILLEMESGLDEAGARANILRRYDSYLGQLEAWDARQVRELFLSCMFGSFDAHSGYSSRETAKVMEEQVNGSSMGFGVDYALHNGHLHVSELVTGGPAGLSCKVPLGARLLGVGAPGEEPQDARSWNHSALYGALNVEDGAERTFVFGDEQGLELSRVTLRACRHERPEGHASGTLVEVPGKDGPRRIGLVDIPAFHYNPEAEGGISSTSKDLGEILRKFKEGGAEAVVVDLRDNPGGVMREALLCAGFFIPSGPVFRTRGLDRSEEVMSDEDGECLWPGPVVVLVSGRSASASEAFSGALKWHRRALIVGDEQTFGKGSAQDYIDLRSIGAGGIDSLQSHWGMLRLTRMLFYFPNGKSPQLEGVSSDIVLPSYWRDDATHMERDEENALPTEQLPDPLEWTRPGEELALLQESLIGRLREASLARQSSLSEFAFNEAVSARRRREQAMDAVPLTPELWLAMRETLEKERLAHNLEWESRVESEGFPHQLVYTEAVERVYARQKEAVFGHTREGDAGVLQGLLLLHRTPDGRALRIPVPRLDLRLGILQAERHGAAWLEATGRQAEIDDVKEQLRVIDRALRGDNPLPELRTLLGEGLGKGLSPELVERGLIALLETQAKLDGLDAPPRFFMDMRRREALRIAADWAIWLQPSSEKGVVP